uniref:Beta-galactosidase n=1 Tax=Heterorhabditis bacteriophora TaxID=37862 RepID=A0A1I7XRK7_HETBA
MLLFRMVNHPGTAPVPTIWSLTEPIQLNKVNGSFDNYFLYWKGRACGLDYIAPFLQPTDYRPAEVGFYNFHII